MPVLAALLFVVGSGSVFAASSQESPANAAAGLIIDAGEGEPVFVVVTFDEGSMSAVDLLRAADLDAVTVEFGGLGEGVCEIVRVGCDVSTCRQRLCQTGDPESPFWQYWEQGDDGTWSLSPRGASHAEVRDGDIAAWIWTGVDPQLEPIAWEELASRAGAPDDLITGDISGPPAVHASGLPRVDDEGGDAAGTLAAIGAVAVIGLMGGMLVAQQRRRPRSSA